MVRSDGFGLGCLFAQAQAEMVALMIPIDKTHTDLQGWTAWVAPFTESIVGQVRPLMWMLFGAVSLVLLIACGNVANLLMARAAGRVHELGVRSALGAERARLIRQMITEALLLASAGGAIGIALAFGGVNLLLKLNPGDIPRLNDISIDGRVLLFSVVVSLATGFVFGLLPALSASRIDVMKLLKQGGSKGAAGTSNRLRHALIVAEVALSVILLTGAGLLIRSYQKIVSEGPGFSSSGHHDADIHGRYQDREARAISCVYSRFAGEDGGSAWSYRGRDREPVAVEQCR